METNWAYESDSYCENCLPVSTNHPDVFDGSGESDYPIHCCGCNRPLDYSLTADGIDYVIGRIKESLRSKEHLVKSADPFRVDGWYEGSPAFAPVRDWAEDLSWYGGLTVKQTNLIQRYLELTEWDPAEIEPRSMEENVSYDGPSGF